MVTFEEAATTMDFQDIDGAGTRDNIVDLLARWTDDSIQELILVPLDDYIASTEPVAAQ